MGQFAFILFTLGIGALLRRTRTLPSGTHRVLNAVVVNLSLPAFTLLHLHRLPFDSQALFPIAMAWILFLSGAGFIFLLGRARDWSPQTMGALILTGGLANTSFVGFPMLEALFGPEALSVGVLTDQPGSFLVLSTLGVGVASLAASTELSLSQTLRQTLRRVLSFPAFHAMVAALALSRYDYPEAISITLERFSVTLVPLALLSVGLQLEINGARLKFHTPRIVAGLLFKLVLGPALIALLYLRAFGAQGTEISISIIQAAMPPMIMGAVLANDYDLEPELANLMVGIGIPISFLTVPAWYWLLQRLN
ncbi:MAG: hypothetical protein A2X94_00765 [Bdellovibrionales bacterium GWB1_55_8]|nr:MAG: hypothetical protein A2X94_00765 [Bdellovibrionales bacterium GWB1_55_8]